MRDYFDWAFDPALPCKGMDPNIFCRPKDDYEVGQAKRACRLKCPAKQDCLMHAIIYDETGIWGGYSEEERYEMAKQGRRMRLIQISSQAGIFHPELMRRPAEAA